jgi:hypothetical protein
MFLGPELFFLQSIAIELFICLLFPLWAHLIYNIFSLLSSTRKGLSKFDLTWINFWKNCMAVVIT